MSQTAANRGFHPILAAPTQRLFIDTCMQAWPDADYANAHRHGVDAMAVTAWMPHATVDQALEGIMYWHLITRTNPSLEIAYQAHDIPLAKAAGKATFVLTAQDGDFIGNKLHRVEAFYRLGLRIMLPAYNSASLLCDGCLDRADAGLTRFGMMVVAEANRVGLLLDGTHVGRRSSLEMIDASEDPVIFSHSNPRARAENPRNIDDEQILACARRGGVIGLVPWGPLVFTEEQTTWPTLHQFLDCQGTSSFPHLRDIHFPALLAGHRLVAWASICRSLKLLPSMFTTWQWCSRRSRMAVARISSPASMSGHWLMLLLLVMMVAPLS